MSSMLNLTAAQARAILCFIDPTNTPKIAYDRDDLAQPLIDKVKENLGNRDGSQPTFISFREGEEELQRQFSKVCDNMGSIFSHLSFVTEKQ